MSERDETRQAELVGSLGTLRSRISDACTAAGRDPHEVTLIAVTKTYPASDIATLARLGVYDIGESKDQEARRKVAELAAESSLVSTEVSAALRWHLVGRLQTNKARSVVGYAHTVHSVDRPKLARALADAAAAIERPEPLAVFVQVSIDDDPARGGVSADALGPLADDIARRSELRLAGVMSVAPIHADPDVAFARLRELSAQLRVQYPEADAISAGMSADLEAAVRNGATHVRVGTALLGRRDAVFG